MKLASLPAWTKILLLHEEGDNNIKLSKKTGLQYDTVLKNISLLEEKGAVTRETRGRETMVALTFEGLMIKGALIIIETTTKK